MLSSFTAVSVFVCSLHMGLNVHQHYPLVAMTLLSKNKYDNSIVCSHCGPGNVYFISIWQMSLPVIFQYFVTY